MSSPAKKQKLSHHQEIAESTELPKVLVNIVDEYVPKLYIYHLTSKNPGYSDWITVASTPNIAKHFGPDGSIFFEGKWHDLHCLECRSFFCSHEHCKCQEPDAYHYNYLSRDLDAEEIGISTNKKYKEGDVIFKNRC